jgi:hypothetical protein
MNGLMLTPVEVIGGLGALVGLLWARRAGARRARAAVEAARSGARVVSVAGRVLVNAALIVIVQWMVIAHGGGGWLLAVVLVVPALFAAYALTRALTVTTSDLPRRRGGGRR